MADHGAFPRAEVAGDDARPCLADEPEVEGQVVDRGDLQAQQLLDLDEVMEIRLAVERVHVGVGVGVDGREVVLPFLVAHVDRPEAGEELAVAAVARGHDAIEHVDAPLDGLQEVDRRADAHEVAGLVFGKDLVDDLDHLVHLLGRLAHGQSADRVAVGPLAGDMLRRPHAQVLVDAALHDGEEALRITVFGLGLPEAGEATVEPMLGQAERAAGVVVVRVARAAFVEGHDDVRADRALEVHHFLGREEMLRAVDVRAEICALGVELAVLGEGEDLEAAAVGQDRPVPSVETMQAARLLKDGRPWAEIKMVGVP